MSGAADRLKPGLQQATERFPAGVPPSGGLSLSAFRLYACYLRVALRLRRVRRPILNLCKSQPVPSGSSCSRSPHEGVPVAQSERGRQRGHRPLSGASNCGPRKGSRCTSWRGAPVAKTGRARAKVRRRRDRPWWRPRSRRAKAQLAKGPRGRGSWPTAADDGARKSPLQGCGGCEQIGRWRPGHLASPCLPGRVHTDPPARKAGWSSACSKTWRRFSTPTTPRIDATTARRRPASLAGTDPDSSTPRPWRCYHERPREGEETIRPSRDRTRATISRIRSVLTIAVKQGASSRHQTVRAVFEVVRGDFKARINFIKLVRNPIANVSAARSPPAGVEEIHQPCTETKVHEFALHRDSGACDATAAHRLLNCPRRESSTS